MEEQKIKFDANANAWEWEWEWQWQSSRWPLILPAFQVRCIVSVPVEHHRLVRGVVLLECRGILVCDGSGVFDAPWRLEAEAVIGACLQHGYDN